MPAGHPGIIQPARNPPARVPARCGFGTTTPRISAAVWVPTGLERPLLNALAAPDPSATGERLSRLAGIPAPEANADGCDQQPGHGGSKPRSSPCRSGSLGHRGAVLFGAAVGGSADLPGSPSVG